MSIPEENPVENPSEDSLNRSHDSIQLNCSEILEAPLCSRDLLDLHLRYLEHYGDEIINSNRNREIFKAVGKNKVLDEILQTCRNIHDAYENELPELLRTLFYPLDQMNDPNLIPEIVINRLREYLTDLRHIEQSANKLIGDLNDMLYKKGISGNLLSTFSTSIERSVLQAIIKYWARSGKEIIARCTEQITLRDFKNGATNSPPAIVPPSDTPSRASPVLNLPPVHSPSDIPLRVSIIFNCPPPASDPSNTRRLGLDLSKAKIPRFMGRKEEFSMFFALLNEILEFNRDYPETTRIAFLRRSG